MKKFLILGLIAFGILAEADGQRRRTTAVFDGDIWTRPAPGTYGIGVRDFQPYLIGPVNDPVRIKTEHAYIVGVQLNSNDTIEYPGGSYQGRRTELVSLNKDSLLVTLPNPRDSINNGRDITFTYHGFSGQLFSVFDDTYAFRFSDTVFIESGETYVFMPNTWIGSMTTQPAAVARNIKPNTSFVLSVYNRRWYLHFNKINY
jgi:hypothetical protein